MEDCIFCKVVNHEIGSEVVYEDEQTLAFKDIYPQAPVHILVIPKKHISSVNGLQKEDSQYVEAIFKTIQKVAYKFNLTEGYRVITNVGPHACQSVFHLHYHILGGRQLTGQMG
jgi:histidine triad (HIT) family protein